MSTSENPFAHEMPAKQKSDAALTGLAGSKPLRWWPAAVLLLAMIIIKLLPAVLESVSMTVLMIGFMGPAGVSLLIMMWWMFASRASVKEKLIGAIGVAALGVVSASLLHFTMKGMSVVLFLIPAGVGLFGLALVVFANRPAVRLSTALICSAVGFGVWDLLLSEGVTGKFDPELGWRWSPTREQKYLRSLADRGAEAQDDADITANAETVTRGESQWSDFRGPLRDGKQPGIVLEEDWKKAPPRLVWKTPIGPGWSSFTVAGNRLFTQEQRGDNEVVVCLNAETGSILWTHEYPGRFWEAIAGAGPRATPTIGDEGLVSFGADGQLTCLDPVTGDVRWKLNVQTDPDCRPPMWGYSASPLIHSGLVVIHVGGKGQKGVLAYDAKTGEPRWSVASGNHSYSSPQLASFDGVEGILMSTNDGLQFLNAADGSTIWNHEWKVDNYRATQPLVSGNAVLVSTSLGVGTRQLTVKHEANVWNVTEDWTSLDMKPDYNDFVEYQGHIYGFDGNIFACVSLETGKRQWKKGRYGNGQVLLLPDAGQMLVISETGELVLLKADPDKHVEIAKIPAIEGKTWNHPVLIGNRLYLRNGEEAACYELQL